LLDEDAANPRRSNSDKIASVSSTIVGAAKMGVGDAVGNPKLKAEGVTQNLAGKAQVAIANAKDAVKRSSTTLERAAGRHVWRGGLGFASQVHRDGSAAATRRW
jgi:uncharacterized protein YjbJ (UPF0337 family)